MNKIALFLLLAASASAHADGVTLAAPVTYAAEASVVTKVRQECQLENRLATDINAALANTTTPAGEALRVTILDVMGVGGGAWSGPKSISLRVELMKDGKVERSTRLTRTTGGGAFGGFKGTCAMLERDSATLGKDVARWAGNESYTTGEDGHN